MSRRPAVRAAAAAMLLPLALTACSGSPSAPAGTGTASASTPAGEGPFNTAVGQTVDTGQFVDGMTSAITDAGTYSITSEADLSGSPMQLKGSADIKEADNPKFNGSVVVGGQGTQMVLVDHVVYLQLAGLAGGKFIKMPLDEIAGSLGAEQLDMFDQRKQLEAQKESIQSVTYGGSTSKDGAQLYKYTVVTDPQALLDQLGATAAPQPTSTAGAGTTLTYDYYLDEKGLPQSVVIDDPSMKSTVNFADWGKPVTIVPPPSNEVTTMPTALPGATG